MKKYLLDFEKIKLIGDISGITVTGIHKHCKGDLLNSPLHYLCVNITFNKLHPASALIKNIPNIDFYFKDLKNVIINLDTYLSLSSYLEVNDKSYNVILMDLNTNEVNIKKHFNIILGYSVDNTFKLGYQSLCTIFNKTIYIGLNSGNGSYFYNLINKDLTYNFEEHEEYLRKVPYYKALALYKIYTDKTTYISPIGKLVYKNKTYDSAEDALNIVDFISNEILLKDI